jgi:hypothetical protein
MIGFEGTRILLLGYALFQDGIRDIRRLFTEILKRAWPYLIVTAGFLYWRMFMFDSSRRATDTGVLVESYLGNIRYMSLRLILETVKDFLDTSIFAWFTMPYNLISATRYAHLGTAVVTAGLVILLVFLYIFLYRKSWGAAQGEKDSGLLREFLWIGSFIIVCAIIPVIFSGRQVDLYDAYKSYGLHPIPGVVLFITGVVLMLQPKFRMGALVALIGISVSAQVLNAYDWANYWEYQRQMWWQLTWRAPDIQDDTLVMTYSASGFNPQQDYEIWGPLNLIYRTQPSKAPAIQAEVLNSDTTENILKLKVLNNDVRDIPLHRDFNNLLLMSMSPVSSCLHIVDGSLPVYSQGEALLLKQVGEYSHVDRIIPTGESPVPPADIFGAEPIRDWCYYYQKASLARQAGDWEAIASLYKEINQRGLNTSDKSEMIPFFEAFVNLGQYDDARSLYRKQIRGSPEVRLSVCESLEKDPGYPPEYGYDYQMVNQILCEE